MSHKFFTTLGKRDPQNWSFDAFLQILSRCSWCTEICKLKVVYSDHKTGMVYFFFFLYLFFDMGDTTFGIRAIPMPHISVLDWPSYLSRHKLASWILRKCKCFFHVSSTTFSFLQSRFADALLRELAGVTIPPERIYGLGTGLVRVFFLWLRKLCLSLTLGQVFMSFFDFIFFPSLVY